MVDYLREAMTSPAIISRQQTNCDRGTDERRCTTNRQLVPTNYYTPQRHAQSSHHANHHLYFAPASQQTDKQTDKQLEPACIDKKSETRDSISLK